MSWDPWRGASVVTALAQSILGCARLAIAGVPWVGILTAWMLMLSIAQLGAFLVLPAAATRL